MKIKILIIFLLMITAAPSSYASIQLKVKAETVFCTDRPSSDIEVIIREDNKLGQYELKAGDKLGCRIVDISEPKRAKRNANFSVRPVYIISNGHKQEIKEEFIGKYSKTVISKEELKNIPKGEIAEKAAKTAANCIKKGLGQGISLAEGMIKNEEGSRVKSGVKQVYEDSVFSYVEKGHELDIEPDEDFYFVFKGIDEENENLPNYTYTAPEEE